MSGQSALLGNPPTSPNDKLVAVAIKALAGSEFFPNPAHPYGQPRPSPNPPNPWDAGHIVGLCFFFIIFLFFLVIGRMIIRWKQTKVTFGLDDLFIIPSVATSIVCDALVIYISYSECYGHHIYWCSYDNLANLYEALYVNQTIFWIALYFAKISIVFFNRRLTTLAQGWWKIGHWVVLAIVVACFIIALFSTIFECTPVKAHYNLHALGSTLLENPKLLHCVDSTKLELANRWLHVITDLMLLSVPLIILYRLQMPTHKKVSIGFLFCFGIVCCIASIVRNYVWANPSEDFTFDSGALIIWDLVDVNFAPIVACLPVYYPVLNWVFRETKSRLPTSLRASGKGSSGNNGSQDPQNSVAKVKGSFFQKVHGHKPASSSLDNIKGPYIRADDSRLNAIAAGKGNIATYEKSSMPLDGRGPVPLGRIRRDDEFELKNSRQSDEEQLYKGTTSQI